jgi:hypothetical protein
VQLTDLFPEEISSISIFLQTESKSKILSSSKRHLRTEEQVGDKDRRGVVVKISYLSSSDNAISNKPKALGV